MRPYPSIPREAYFGKLPVCKKIVRLWWASRPLGGADVGLSVVGCPESILETIRGTWA